MPSVTYKELVKDKIPSELVKYLPTSFDIIGKIIVVKLHDKLLPYKSVIGGSFLTAYKNIRTVAIDYGVKGDYRIRDLEIIGGVNNTETVYKEYGISLTMDISKVYFSPRLSTERWRVVQCTKENETIVDMFAGVGPYSIMLAKHRCPQKVYSIECNPIAIKYLKLNIEKNKVNDTVVPIYGDAKREIHRLSEVDRIVMNLPHSAYLYINDAVSALKRGGVIHYYEIAEDIGYRIDKLKSKGYEILNCKIVKEYSAKKKLFDIDFKKDFIHV